MKRELRRESAGEIVDQPAPRADATQAPAGPGRRVSDLSDPAGVHERLIDILGRATSPAALSANLIGAIQEALPVRAWLASWDSDTPAACWLPGGDPPFPLSRAGETGSLLSPVVRDGTRLTIRAAQDSKKYIEGRHLARQGGAWLILPLQAAGHTTGVLVVRSDSADLLEAPAMGTLERLAPVMALNLRIGLLQRELENRVDERTAELSILYDISRSLGVVLTTEDLFHLVGSSLKRSIPFELGAFLLALPGRQEMAVQLGCDAEERAVRRVCRLALAELERLTGRKAGRIPTSYARIDAAGGEPALRADEIRSLAHVPLFIRGQVMGLLTVATRKPDAYGEAAMRLLYTIANQASLTLDRLHTAREAESSRIHSMLESMADGVMLLDLDLRLVMSNPAARSYLGALTGGRPGKVLRQLGELELRPLLESFAQPEARARTFEAAASSPESRIFSITCSPVRGLDAGVQGMVVVLSDITEARHLQMQLAQSEKLSAIGEMISGVAHELNNPLASVMGFAQLLQGAQVGEEVHAKLRAIDHEATRCRQVVQNLLRFARRHTPERRLLNINEVVDSVLQLLGHQLRVDDIHVELDLQADLPMVNGDFHLLQQVVLNVIHNAHQAMKDSRSASGGERAGRLAVASRARGDFVLVEIADNGPGIARENLKRIFDPFFSTKEVGKGTGLGLSLAYGTVREHGGGISAKSQPGEGSIFLIELPAAPAALQAGDRPVLAEAAAVPEPEAAAAASPAHRASRRILIVEDEAPLAEVVCEVLQSMGHQVDTVGDGRLARTRIEQHPYDLIISDLKMPNMSGRELYRHVAAMSPELARRIIFSTGDTANPDTRAFFEETGNPFLAKPFNLKDLIHLVDSVLEAT